MRAVIQRVQWAQVVVNGVTVGKISHGLLVYLGIDQMDDDSDIEWLSRKLVQVRIFEDEQGKMNRSLIDIEGEMLLVSQFTLFGNLQKGSRPSFNHAALPDKGQDYFDRTHRAIEGLLAKSVPTGIFAADMKVTSFNDGPVTLFIDSRNRQG
jgi:D-tyrosyl-tRNA(Tyr) deacylase